MEPPPQNHFREGPLEGLGLKSQPLTVPWDTHDSTVNVLFPRHRDKKGDKYNRRKILKIILSMTHTLKIIEKT